MRNIISSEYWCRCVMIMTTNIKYCGFVYRDVEHDDNDRQSDYHPGPGKSVFQRNPSLSWKFKSCSSAFLSQSLDRISSILNCGTKAARPRMKMLGEQCGHWTAEGWRGHPHLAGPHERGGHMSAPIRSLLPGDCLLTSSYDRNSELAKQFCLFLGQLFENNE